MCSFVFARDMPGRNIEDLKVYEKAVAAADAVFAITSKAAFNADPELRQQLRTSSGRIQAHLQESSGQKTDKHKAHYISIARGSAKETKAHLRRALGYGFISNDEYREFWNRYDELAAMLTGLLKYLERDDDPRP
jgi:four helix bundle protein